MKILHILSFKTQFTIEYSGRMTATEKCLEFTLNANQVSACKIKIEFSRNVIESNFEYLEVKNIKGKKGSFCGCMVMWFNIIVFSIRINFDF